MFSLGHRGFRKRIVVWVSGGKQRLVRFAAASLLPSGFPTTVSPDYVTYQVNDTLQAMCSSLSGTLATHAVLTGLGVGRAEANAAAATAVAVLRDCCGMVGRIGFAAAWGKDLDANAKTWRFMADVTNDLAMSLEIVASVVGGEWFVTLACSAAVVRAVTAVAGGATRTAVTQHQAIAGNISDVAAKDGSQETCVNLVAMALGLALTPWLTSSSALTLGAFSVLTFFHLLFNYWAVSRGLVLRTLNKQRFGIVYATFAATEGARVPTPAEVAREERILWLPFLHDRPRVKVGVSAEEAEQASLRALSLHRQHDARHATARNGQPEHHRYFVTRARQQPGRRWAAILDALRPQRSGQLGSGEDLVVLLQEGATAEDQIHGYLASLLFRSEAADAPRSMPAHLISDHAARRARELWPVFRQRAIDAGWNLDAASLGASDWRYKLIPGNHEDEKEK